MTKVYEVTVLLPASFAPDQVKSFGVSFSKLVASHKGKIEKEEQWGKKTLAYEIAKEKEALYLFYEISLDTTETQTFERNMRLMESIIRSLLVIKEEV